MNIRKPVDYSQMYEALDDLLVSSMEQTKLFCEIGKVIDERPEKGAAVAAADYITATYPNKRGFSPRGLRRMRDFYRAYKNDPSLVEEAMGIRWSLNALIIETCEDHDIRKWYVKACLKNGWSKQQLASQITEKAHENSTLDPAEDQSQFENQVALENEETVRVESGMPYTMGNLHSYASKDCLKVGIRLGQQSNHSPYKGILYNSLGEPGCCLWGVDNKTAALMNTPSPVGVLSQMHEEENTTKQSPGSRYRESSIGLKKKRILPNREKLRETEWSGWGIIPFSYREKMLVPSR